MRPPPAQHPPLSELKQKLFQAVEEARALLGEGLQHKQHQQQHKQQQLKQQGRQAATTNTNTNTTAAVTAPAASQQRPQRSQRSQTPDQQQQTQQQLQQQGKQGKQQQQAVGSDDGAVVRVPSYPPPAREDMSRSSKQLLKWLRAAAADPEVCWGVGCGWVVGICR